MHEEACRGDGDEFFLIVMKVSWVKFQIIYHKYKV